MFRFQTLWEARFIFAVLLALLAGTWLLRARITCGPFLACLLLLVFVVSFFRDPERQAPADPLAVAAAADGLVKDIAEVEPPQEIRAFLPPAQSGAKMRRVGIFLSVFNVHTNRAPIAGKVLYSAEREGLYLDARDPQAGDKNACRTWVFQNARATVAVRQLTGLIARRIVGWARVGDELSKGERFGMIRFGSRTEIYLPLDARVLVKEGERVRAGESVIARLAEPAAPAPHEIPAAP